MGKLLVNVLEQNKQKLCLHISSKIFFSLALAFQKFCVQRDC